MKVAKDRLKEIITEELSRFYDAGGEGPDWGRGRYNTHQYRSQMPLNSLEELEDDHVEVAIRDAIHNDEDLERFEKEETMVKGYTNAEALAQTLEDTVQRWWSSWEDDPETLAGDDEV